MLAVCGWCTFGSTIGYILRGPTAATALAAALLIASAITVLWSVLLGGSDPRSPFVRFMLLTCVLTGRPPDDYLPSNPDELPFADDVSDPGQVSAEVVALVDAIRHLTK